MPLSLRHPKRTLVVAALVIVFLGILGLNVESRLSPTSLDVGGTQSSRANAMLQRYFGDSAPFPILLRGPAAALDRQGPALIRALRRDPAVTTISPWDQGGVANLRPSPNKALILADFHVGLEKAVKDTVPYLNETLEAQITPPVRATQTGYASISRAIQDESIHSAEKDELIALPFLLLVLLLVFRSPVAAMIPLIFGVITVISIAGRPHDRQQLLLGRRLRAHGQLDDGPGPRGGLRPADGLALPRGAGRRRRAARPPGRPGAPPAAPRSSPAARSSSRCSSRSSSCRAPC